MKAGAGKQKQRVNLRHLGFGDLLAERGSPGMRVVPEWSLPVRMRRADFLLIRREDRTRDHEARSLRVFSEHEIRTTETSSWLHQWMLEKKTMLDPKLIKPEGYDEMRRKIAGSLTPEERLRGLPPEERLRDLDDEQAVLALPASVLRHLSEDYLRSLSPAVQQAIRERIDRG